MGSRERYFALSCYPVQFIIYYSEISRQFPFIQIGGDIERLSVKNPASGKGRGQQTRKAPEKQTEAASEKPARSRGGRSRQRRDRRPAAAEILTETPPPLPEPPPLPARTPEATPGIYTPRDEPTWDHPSSDAANSDGLLDSIIRKLLGIKR